MRRRDRRRQPVERAIAPRAAAAIAGLALCGCGGTGPAENAAERNQAAANSPAVEVRPGLWEVRSAIVAVSEQGLPREIAEQMKGPRRTVRRCITPEEAARPAAGLLAARRTGRCSDEAVERRDGRIEGAMTCRDEAGAATRLRIGGRYRAEAYEIRIEMETPGIGPGRTMTLVTRQSGRRVGDCPSPPAGG